ncbi:CHAT domain-containing protein [Scytonema hofmannii FACHB-248]|uniref:CHAT domain-containing protein n=1 Tax=Scytonema hofmannii FACHB-248 TaxID=1842502 RepID=A0ABR8GL42_9CYAN|nr:MULTISPECIES: CHAT domain-containing protein [Nostocales]MBD2603878.1 CHAT domain-containing protein [Scytonema hofmannii FACHB-248]
MKEIIEKLNQLNREVVQLVEQGNFEQAVIVTQQAIKLGRENIQEHSALADSLNNLAELYRMQGRFLLAKPLYIEVLNMRKRLFGSHPDVAQSLNNLAAFYVSQGRYLEAESNFFAALNIWKHYLGKEHSEIATNLENIAEVYREQGRYLDAEKMHIKALDMRKRLFGDSHPDIAQSLDNLAVLYKNQARYLEAEKIHLEALNMRKSLLGEEHWYIAVSFNNLAALYNSQGRFSQAEENYSKALELCKKTLGSDHPYVAITLNNIADIYKNQGRYLDAEKMNLEALAMRKRFFGDEHLEVAMSWSNLGDVYLQQGRYKDAERMYVEAYTLKKRLLTSEHPDIALSLYNLAVLYTYQGRYQAAEEKCLESLSLYERLLGNQHPDVADSLSHLGIIYRLQGFYSQAEQKYLEALAIQKNLLGQEHPDIANSLNKLAGIYHLQGRYSQAEQIYLEAYSMSKRLLGEMHPDVAAVINNLGVLYDAQYKHSQAEPLFLEALSIVKTNFGNKHPQVASTINNIATIYGNLGRYSEAESMHLQALEIRKSILSEQHPDITNSLNNLADIYFSLGRYQEAELHYTEALSLRKSLLGDKHPAVALSLNNLATLLTATQRPIDALSCRIQASEINDKMISNIFSFSSENDRLAFLQKIRNNFNLFLSLVYNHLSHSKRAKKLALDFILKRKALTASALAAQNEALYSDRYPHLTEKFRELNDLSNQIIHQTFAVSETDDFTIYQENLAQLQTKYNNLQKELAAQVPEIQLSEQIADRYAVAAALPPDSILVEFVRFDVFNFQAVPAKMEAQWYPARYLAFILKAGQPDAVQMVDLGEVEPIDNLISGLRSHCTDNTKITLGWVKKAAAVPKLPIKPYNPTTATQLCEMLFQPIRNAVKDCKHLILAPDGDLNLLPFQILPLDKTGTHLLMDEYTISYLGVGRDILRSKIQLTRNAIAFSKAEPIAPLVIADPDFDFGVDLATDIDYIPDNNDFVKTFIASEASPTGELLKVLGDRLSRTLGTRFLGESVAKKLQNARLYMQAEALETRLTSSQCPIIMLIATHGLFLPDSQQPPTLKRNLLGLERFSQVKVENPMMRSGLALAGANTWLFGGTLPKKAGKGFVFAQDIASLDLWANELTVLSACDTARGDIKIGEGVFGLRRAFAVAGTKTLVMSLWKVPDKVTALLMERFFDNLRSGMNRAKALQDAQCNIRKITVAKLRKSALGIEVLKELLSVKELSTDSKIDCQEEDTPFEHPFYWGAWICQGDTKPLVLEVLN